MLKYLLIALGGASGSVARYWLSVTIQERFATMLPVGTIMVNVLGSFFIGVAFALLKSRVGNPEIIGAFVIVGLLGGFTTFSAFSLETLGLIEAGFWYKALINVAVSVLCCVCAAYLGISAGSLVVKSF